ncbi:hypothetical protein [Pyrolobus fumarii]|nr:hypothetical protein [Pyrolobus fumarii]
MRAGYAGTVRPELSVDETRIERLERRLELLEEKVKVLLRLVGGPGFASG